METERGPFFIYYKKKHIKSIENSVLNFKINNIILKLRKRLRKISRGVPKCGAAASSLVRRRKYGIHEGHCDKV